jgi:hypothetical protein
MSLPLLLLCSLLPQPLETSSFPPPSRELGSTRTHLPHGALYIHLRRCHMTELRELRELTGGWRIILTVSAKLSFFPPTCVMYSQWVHAFRAHRSAGARPRAQSTPGHSAHQGQAHPSASRMRREVALEPGCTCWEDALQQPGRDVAKCRFRHAAPRQCANARRS